MNDVCNDNRFEMIDRAKKDLLENTNIETSPDEMKVLDNILFRCWQMGWLGKYSDKTETKQKETTNELLLKHLKEIEISQGLIVNGILTAFVMAQDRDKQLSLTDTERELLSHGIIAMQAGLEHIENVSGMTEMIENITSKIKIIEGSDVLDFLKEILK